MKILSANLAVIPFTAFSSIPFCFCTINVDELDSKSFNNLKAV